eukprot:jgi/Botrbrau1/12923/Bobra.92_1s0003.1
MFDIFCFTFTTVVVGVAVPTVASRGHPWGPAPGRKVNISVTGPQCPNSHVSQRSCTPTFSIPAIPGLRDRRFMASIVSLPNNRPRFCTFKMTSCLGGVYKHHVGYGHKLQLQNEFRRSYRCGTKSPLQPTNVIGHDSFTSKPSVQLFASYVYWWTNRIDLSVRVLDSQGSFGSVSLVAGSI